MYNAALFFFFFFHLICSGNKIMPTAACFFPSRYSSPIVFPGNKIYLLQLGFSHRKAFTLSVLGTKSSQPQPFCHKYGSSLMSWKYSYTQCSQDFLTGKAFAWSVIGTTVNYARCSLGFPTGIAYTSLSLSVSHFSYGTPALERPSERRYSRRAPIVWGPSSSASSSLSV